MIPHCSVGTAMSLHPFSQPRTDLTRCCDLSLFSSEIGLFSWEQEKNILQEKQQQADLAALGPRFPSFCVKEEGLSRRGKGWSRFQKTDLVTLGVLRLHRKLLHALALWVKTYASHFDKQAILCILCVVVGEGCLEQVATFRGPPLRWATGVTMRRHESPGKMGPAHQGPCLLGLLGSRSSCWKEWIGVSLLLMLLTLP